MRSFIIKTVLFILPFMMLFPLYIYLDPFKVVCTFKNFYPDSGITKIDVGKDFVSYENFKKYEPVYHYNSFIFGSSRSFFYRVNTWAGYINAPISKCYHFDSYKESLYGITNKVQYLNQNGVPIKNALVVLDHEVFEGKNKNDDYLRLQHPSISDETWIRFQYIHFKTYFNYSFLKNYIANSLPLLSQKNQDPEQTKAKTITYNKILNELLWTGLDELIEADQADYYKKRKEIFYERPETQQYYGKLIEQTHFNQLKYLKKVFESDQTDFRIIINPLYDQLKISQSDIELLQEIFGKEKVFDFSGINEFTKPLTNYYETSHYRPHVSDSILKIIYAED